MYHTRKVHRHNWIESQQNFNMQEYPYKTGNKATDCNRLEYEKGVFGGSTVRQTMF
jgi:hypothetical protein